MNPDAPLEEQVAILPYDPKWEFPRNQLVLGIITNYNISVNLGFDCK